jgi:hypothetical protein
VNSRLDARWHLFTLRYEIALVTLFGRPSCESHVPESSSNGSGEKPVCAILHTDIVNQLAPGMNCTQEGAPDSLEKKTSDQNTADDEQHVKINRNMLI